jgi:SAM-dependent methyltransferase
MPTRKAPSIEAHQDETTVNAKPTGSHLLQSAESPPRSGIRRGSRPTLIGGHNQRGQLMSFYHDRILPFIIHVSMSNRRLVEYRRRTISKARGRVLEIGLGSGLNLPLYGREVSSIHGIDPSTGLLRRASRQEASLSVLVQGSAEMLPFDSGAFDTVVTTWTLCTIPDVLAALCDMRRVLRPDGRLLFVEHGFSTDASVARWQNRLTPCWKCVGGGCHLNRKIVDLIAAGGFDIERLDTGYLRARTPFTFMYEGVARPRN